MTRRGRRCVVRPPHIIVLADGSFTKYDIPHLVPRQKTPFAPEEAGVRPIGRTTSILDVIPDAEPSITLAGISEQWNCIDGGPGLFIIQIEPTQHVFLEYDNDLVSLVTSVLSEAEADDRASFTVEPVRDICVAMWCTEWSLDAHIVLADGTVMTRRLYDTRIENDVWVPRCFAQTFCPVSGRAAISTGDRRIVVLDYV